MGFRTYAYGLKVAAALVAAGTAVTIFYPGAPKTIGIRADDLVEIHEARNERRAALATGPHSGSASNGWNFSAIANLSAIPLKSQMQAAMDDLVYLAPFFYQSSGVPWTVSNLFRVAKIGNLTNLFTVGFTTNHLPIYSNKCGQLIYTNTLFEVFRGFSNMVITARDSAWIKGTNYGWNTHGHPDNLANTWYIATPGENPYNWPKANPPPGWWTDVSRYQWKMRVHTNYFTEIDAILSVDRLTYTNSGTATAAAYESISIMPPATFVVGGRDYSYGLASRFTDNVLPTFWNYNVPEFGPRYWYAAGQYETASRLDSSGGVWFASMDVGVTATVYTPWSSTGQWSRVSMFSSNTTYFGDAGTSVFSVAFSGVNTNWTGYAGAGIKHKITDFVNISGQAATLLWTNDIGYAATHADSIRILPTPTPGMLAGRCDATLGATSWVHWAFSRCHP